MLIRHLTTGEKPSLLWCKIPVVLPGERTSTEDEPAKSLYARLPGIDADPGIWDASLMVGYVWADEPRNSASVVITDCGAVALASDTAMIQPPWNSTSAEPEASLFPRAAWKKAGHAASQALARAASHSSCRWCSSIS